MLLPLGVFESTLIPINWPIWFFDSVNMLPRNGRNSSTLSQFNALNRLIGKFPTSDCFVMICSLITSTIRSLKVSLLLTSLSISHFMCSYSYLGYNCTYNLRICCIAKYWPKISPFLLIHSSKRDQYYFLSKYTHPCVIYKPFTPSHFQPVPWSYLFTVLSTLVRSNTSGLLFPSFGPPFGLSCI